MRPSLKLAAILTIGVLAMSSASILIRFAMAAGAPALVIAAYRLTTAALVLTPPAYRQQVWQKYATLRLREWGLLLLSGMLLALHFAAWITSLAHTSVLSSVALVTTTPLWLGLASRLLLGEDTPRSTWIGMAAAMGGSVLIGLANLDFTDTTSGLGDILALSGAWFMAGYLLIGRSIREKVTLTSYVWLVYAVAAAVLTSWAVLIGLPLGPYSPIAVVYMIALGLVPQLLGHSAANYAVRHVPASLVGVTTLGEPVGATILALIMLQEPLEPLQCIGGVLVLAGIAVTSLVGPRRQPEVAA